ncbi:hypothetical protein PBI_DAMIEN_56 [Mycobacterium phage Damien]|uniref:membrane protein n=1 Tax=Mycobacterium phage Oaker TaxID=1445727 RepID=UPI0003E3E38C|nr:membrane protein [Mycobacterium phage Oaker]YP_009044045.1 membrane protein [Mycobacterium phage Damien]AVO26033.1 hypothetical protein SEA_THUMB_56 [Mycobacterium phage Thumb]QDH84918.1 hypothetical protein SEA_Phreeze_54 [Mycobacterium phage Phreeze]AHG24446.1 hypothetical protein PBI_OAKER_55 [Mycobacterium phage Oaker]AHZ95417.1 hypothetical protein PBI_DAMIEN_56 [Mycobacterium phage Damien]
MKLRTRIWTWLVEWRYLFAFITCIILALICAGAAIVQIFNESVYGFLWNLLSMFLWGFIADRILNG